MTSPPPPTVQAGKDTRADGQRVSLIDRIVRRLFRKLRRTSVDQLEPLAHEPSPVLIPKATPNGRVNPNVSQFGPPSRPVEGTSKPFMRIAIVNHKGGVGKTSTAINLSAALAEMNYKVLVFDCDSQGDLSAVYVPGADQLPQSVDRHRERR